MKLRLIIGSLILFVISLGFNVFFTLSSLQRLHVDSIVSQYRLIGKDLQRRLERGLRYGKKIENFIGVENLLMQTEMTISQKIRSEQDSIEWLRVKFNEDDVSIFVASPDGHVLYGTEKRPNIRMLPESALRMMDGLNTKKKANSAQYTRFRDYYVSSLPVHGDQGTRVGIIAIFLKDREILAFLEEVLKKNIHTAVIISGCGILLLIMLLHFLIPDDLESSSFSKRKISAAVFIVIGSAQILSCSLSTLGFERSFIALNRENTQTINLMLKRDLEFLLQKGLRIEKLIRFDAYLGEVISNYPETKDVTLFDHTNQPLYRATKMGITDFQRSKKAYAEWLEATRPVSDPEYNARTELRNGNSLCGYFSTNTSKTIMFERILDIAIDSLTIVVISVLFFVELLILVFKYVEKGFEASRKSFHLHYSLMRPAAFLFLFGIDLCVSFLPLHMEKLYVPIMGFSKETILGLPISVEFLFVGIAILISGIWLDRRGWHEPFLVGLALAMGGALYSYLAVDAFNFIASRAAVGFGYGLSLMASQGFVIRYSDWKSKAQGLAYLFAGIYAGSICGAATGGMLAESLGYPPVFLISAVIIISVVAYTAIFLRDGTARPDVAMEPRSVPKERSHRILDFLLNRTILGLIFFSSFPAAIAVVGFLNYFSPIYLNRMGASQSTIGQILMIYGVSLIYFGPFLSRYVDASKNKKYYVFLGCVLGSVSFLTFYLLQGILAAIIAVFLLGFSSSFVLASQSAYTLHLRVTRQLGEGTAIGIFRSTSRIGQMFGPIVFSSVIIATSLQKGIAYLGLAYLFTAFLFLVFTHRDYGSVEVE